MKGQEPSDGLLVGLEIHQQLACSTKLFCACPPAKSEEFPYTFERRLRPAQSELGRVDPAAVFEFSKGKSNIYHWSPESSCLVEADEEPPHQLREEALDAALLAARTLGSSLVDEVHVMRKMVIDGSNTSGFQRTAVVGLGGSFIVAGSRVGVQSVTLEEDAARILGDEGGSRRFALDRLGVALVEVALDPVSGDPEFVGRVALHLGRILRSTGRVARGLGTIRQDLNVSMMGGKVVEVKGIQKLNLLPRVVEYERKRQLGLIQIAERLRKKGAARVRCRSRDVTRLLAGTSSTVMRKLLDQGGRASCIVAPGLGGMIGWEPFPGVRLGKELAEVARANALGGVIHSDEFGAQGVSGPEAAALKEDLRSGDDDALVLVAGPQELVERVTPLLMARLEGAADGVPAETRAATDDGETRYMRPRPGSQRMYPETDIQDITVAGNVLDRISRGVPEDWEARVVRLEKEFSLSRDMALKVYDSDTVDDFLRISRELRLEPSFVASVLVDLPTRLGREGVSEEGVALTVLEEVLRAVDSGLAAKEVVPDILKAAAARGVSVSEAVESLGIRAAQESEVRNVVESVVARHMDLVTERGAEAFSPLMGEAMKQLRGRADGETVSGLLRKEIAKAVGGRGPKA